MKRTMIDLFAGIGGFTLGFEAAGFECIGHCEIDRYAQRSYYAIHGKKEGAWFADDITTVRPEDLPPCDLITAGFPCQDNTEEIVIPKIGLYSIKKIDNTSLS